MAAPLPQWASQPGYYMQPPSTLQHAFNPNFQSDPILLADNMQNLNLNSPVNMHGLGPRPPHFAQPMSYTCQTLSAPSSGHPSSPGEGHPDPQNLPNVVQLRSNSPPISQPPPSFVSRPPPSSCPSSVGGPFVPPAVTPSNLPPPGARPSLFSSAPPLSTASVMSSSGVPASNGPSLFGSRPLTSGSPMGPPPTMSSVRPLPHAPVLIVGARPNASMQPPGPPPPPQPPSFSAEFQGVPPSTGFGYGPQVRPMHHHQVVSGPPIPGSTQSPRMYGMTPTLPHQSTTVLPLAGQTGAPSAKPWVQQDQMPRPFPSTTTVVHETQVDYQANHPTPVRTDSIARDTGNCSAHYMRCTINQIPCTADLLSVSGMQLALLVQPLALPHPSEEPIQVVDFGERGPVRCSRCKGYINPCMKFIDQGKRFICNLCGFVDETPHDYHCNLGPDGRRRDVDERPELCRGTVEFVATREYMLRNPMPAIFFFLVDVSINAVQTGATAASCSAISQVISDLPEGPRTLVGFATFDSTIHFYNLKRSFRQPLMLVVPDVLDVYTPLPSDIVVQLSECRQHLESLLESIPTMFENNKTIESAFGAAIKGASLVIKNTGGKLMVFQSVLPSIGIGSLLSREGDGKTNISAEEKESQKLLQPADNILTKMALEFAEYQVCVDVFITAQSYVDIASISVIPRTTGGQVYYYHPFSALSDPCKLYNDLRWNITRPQGFEAVMRLRCSPGIQVEEYSGNFCKRIQTDIDLSAIDCDKTIKVALKHDDKLQDGSACSFQCALLYTTLDGHRRIRVINLSLPCTNVLNNLFRSADVDAQVTCILKEAAREISSRPASLLKDKLTNQCINILLSYRKFCATVSSPTSELILPETLTLLPLYTLALMKSKGLRSDGSKVDERSFWINYVSFLSATLAVPLMYPRMVAIHDLHLKEDDMSLVPPQIPLSIEHLKDEGIYLLENGDDALVYIGNSADSDILQQLFGFSNVNETPTQFLLEQYENPLSKKLNNVVNEIRRQRCSYLRLKLCKKGDPSEKLFLSYLIEDASSSGPSYQQFLVNIHGQIRSKLSQKFSKQC